MCIFSIFFNCDILCQLKVKGAFQIRVSAKTKLRMWIVVSISNIDTITTGYWSRLHPAGRQEGGVVFEKERRTFPF
jgi:hypothetical protein